MQTYIVTGGYPRIINDRLDIAYLVILKEKKMKVSEARQRRDIAYVVDRKVEIGQIGTVLNAGQITDVSR